MKWLSRRIACPGPYLVLCTSEKEFLKINRKLKNKIVSNWIIENSNATTHSLYRENGDLCCVVCIEADKRNQVEIFGLLVHEAVHVWQCYAMRIGETNPGSEQMAYAIQSISQELIQAYLSKKV
jgi:hypothetical protein